MHTRTHTRPLPLKCFYFFVCALYVIMYHALIYVFALSQTGLTAPNRQEWGESLEASAQPACVHSGSSAPAGGVDPAATGMRLEDGNPLALNLVIESKMCLWSPRSQAESRPGSMTENF